MKTKFQVPKEAYGKGIQQLRMTALRKQHRWEDLKDTSWLVRQMWWRKEWEVQAEAPRLARSEVREEGSASAGMEVQGVEERRVPKSYNPGEPHYTVWF